MPLKMNRTTKKVDQKMKSPLLARMSFKVDKAKRHVLGFMGIQIGDVQHHGSYESERSDSHIFIWTN